MGIKMKLVDSKKKTWDWTEIGKKMAKLTGSKSLKITSKNPAELIQIQKGVYWYAKTRLSFKIATEFPTDVNGKKDFNTLIISRLDGRIRRTIRKSRKDKISV